MDNLKSGFERRIDGRKSGISSISASNGSSAAASPELNRFRGKLFYFDDECQREINYKGTNNLIFETNRFFRSRPVVEIHRRGRGFVPHEQDHALHFQKRSKTRSGEAGSGQTTTCALESAVAKRPDARCCAISWSGKSGKFTNSQSAGFAKTRHSLLFVRQADSPRQAASTSCKRKQEKRIQREAKQSRFEQKSRFAG